jgi:cyanobactin maturation PatA/PatG family protease
VCAESGEHHATSIQLVYAIGSLAIDFGNAARRESFRHAMSQGAGSEQAPEDPSALLSYLKEEPSESASILWVLMVGRVPSYIIQPTGAFASDIYRRLVEVLDEQVTKGVERMTLPGAIVAHGPISTGATLPIVVPTLRSMFTWTMEALVEALLGDRPKGRSSGKSESITKAAMRSVVDRVLNDYVNLGVRPEDRALNYAITDVSRLGQIVRGAADEGVAFVKVMVEPSPVTPQERQWFDVVWTFVDPQNDRGLKQHHRFTVDVTDVSPVPVGEVRAWAAPKGG